MKFVIFGKNLEGSVGVIEASTKEIAAEIFTAATGLLTSGLRMDSQDFWGEYWISRMDRSTGEVILREGEIPSLPPLPESRQVDCGNGYVLHVHFIKSFNFLGEGPRFSIQYFYTGNEEKSELSSYFSSSSIDKGLPKENHPGEGWMISIATIEQLVKRLIEVSNEVTFLNIKSLEEILPKDIVFFAGLDKSILQKKDEWSEVRDGLAFDASGSLESTIIGWTEEHILVLLTYEEYRDWDFTDTVNVVVKYSRNPPLA
jgi:hypothetical protein